MNVHLKPIDFKKYALILIYSFIIMAIIAWCMEFYFEKLYGDLTRLGSFSERDFGWREPQPEIDKTQLKNYAINEADILVIGDSFSISRVWQTQLVKQGLKVCTLTWSEVKTSDAIASNLGQLLRQSGFKGKYLIIENVERVFQRRMKAMLTIEQPIVKKEIAIDSAFQLYPFSIRERMTLNKLNGADWGTKTLYNKIKLLLDVSEKHLKSGMVQAIKFNGCEFFSHRLCQYMLFIASDFTKEPFDFVNNVRIINTNLQSVGIQTLWIIVPDKATVYLGYGNRMTQPYHNIWQTFKQQPDIIAPNIAEAFIKESRKIKDFYLPDDTHLSSKGYLYLGGLILNVLHQLENNPSQPVHLEE